MCANDVWRERPHCETVPLMLSDHRSQLPSVLAAAALALACASAFAACGSDQKDSKTTAASRNPIPPALRSAESASEDIIDLALDKQRAEVVSKAKALKAVADGPAASALRRVGAPAGEIAAFQRRAATVARLAADAPLLDVALASNAAFELVPGFFERYDNPVPATVIRLDYLDFAAKLRSLKGETRVLRTLVSSLDATWRGLRPQFVAAGGARVAPAFDEHVAAMRKLVANREPARTQREAQHGLDLVDELEHVYAG